MHVVSPVATPIAQHSNEAMHGFRDLTCLHLDNPAADGDSQGLRAMCRAKFLHDVLDMNLDRLFRNEETVGNFTVSIALGDASEDLDLTWRQGFIAEVFGKASRDYRRYALFPGMHSPDRIHETFVRHTLQQVRPRPGFQGAANFDISFERRQYDDSRFRKIGANGDQGIHAAHVGQSQIHECYVGPMLPEGFDAFRPIRRFRNEHHIRLIVNDRRDPLAQKRMVVYTENVNALWIAHRCSLVRNGMRAIDISAVSHSRQVWITEGGT